MQDFALNEEGNLTNPSILVVGHGPFPAALVESARMIGGALENVRTLGLQPGVTPNDFADELRAAIRDAAPSIVMSDLFGGTPHNVARLVLRDHPGVVLMSAVSLPLLLEVAFADDLSPEALDLMREATAARVVSASTPSA